MPDSISPVLFSSVSNVTATNSVELGTRVRAGLVDYIYCYNGGAAAIGQGQCGFLSPASMLSNMTVTVSNAAAQTRGMACVGVAHNAAIPASSYGFLAVRGPVLVALDTAAVSMNSSDILAAGVDGGFVVAPVTQSTGVRLGIALNSLVTTVGTGKAFFKSPLFG